MKKLTVPVLLFFLALCSTAYAHPPSDVIITYDPGTKMLKAVIMHNVSNPQNHYIKKVDVAINGQEIIEHQISRQDNNISQTVTYLIPDGKVGDRISVEAYCSISGKLEKEIDIKDQ